MADITTEITRRQQELAELRAIPSATVNPVGRILADTFERTLADIYRETEELREALRPTVLIDVDPIVIPPAEVRVNVPDQRDAINQLAALVSALTEAILTKETTVNVTVDAVPVDITMTMPHEPSHTKTVRFTRDPNGRITSAEITEE